MLYLEWMVQNNKVTFYATATSKAMTVGLQLLEERLPVELATRSLALYNYQNSLDCSYYFEQTGCVIPDLSEICAKSSSNFTNVDNLMMFVNATWYGDYSAVEAYTGLSDNTDGCLTAFYDSST
jgi:hypothetical protein